jgi:hypothetical protein
VVANDFPSFFAEYPAITQVFFNGAMAEHAFRRRVLPAMPDDRHVFARLPSTSPADTMPLAAKIAAWSNATWRW